MTETADAFWERLNDPRRLPGRWYRKLRLLRPSETFSPWFFFWVLVALGCAYFLFHVPNHNQEALRWLAGWALGAAFAAAVTVVWQDGIKSPQAVRRIRRRIKDDPQALLRSTLAEQRTKIIELDPPLVTVPREDLYEELLPGILARHKKDVQIIVGGPGAGKTTALIDLSSVLSKIGYVPVLIDLRGDGGGKDLFELAKNRFEQQVRPLVRTAAEADIVWRWLCRRQRVVIIGDDADQASCDRDPGSMMRRLLEEVASEGQAVVVTARPAGVPVGIAASAVTMEPFGLERAVDLVASPALNEPGAAGAGESPRARIERWIKVGELTEVPLYLEVLAELTAARACPDLPEDPKPWGSNSRPGRSRKISGRRREWNPVWARYLLLKQFGARIADGTIRQSLAIDEADRVRSLRALERAALGSLGATGMEAAATAMYEGDPAARQQAMPKRTKLADFIGSDDRQDFKLQRVNSKVVKQRTEVSQHEAIDTGARLRILEERHGELQFRHRILQAFLAGRCLARVAEEGAAPAGDEESRNGGPWDFESWVEALMNPHHPEKLTAHLALVFAAVDVDDRNFRADRIDGAGRGRQIARLLLESAQKAPEESGTETITLAEQLNPSRLSKSERRDPDDELIKLSTAAIIVGLLRSHKNPKKDDDLAQELVASVKPATADAEASLSENGEAAPAETGEDGGRPDGPDVGAMRWTKIRVLTPIAELDTKEAWKVVWEFTRDLDYDVRHEASHLLERNAHRAYPKLKEEIEGLILKAKARAGEGLPLQSVNGHGSGGWDADLMRSFIALGWVLPAIVSGLSEKPRSEPDQTDLDNARFQLETLCKLAYGTGRHEMEESLAQGFKADAMRHTDPDEGFAGPGWIANNRRLVAEFALPGAESWYARMLLYQALALYAIAAGDKEGSFAQAARRLHRNGEQHPFAREAAKLACAALDRARVKRERWKAFIWSDAVQDAGRLPTSLDPRTAKLVGDVAVLVDLKEGSPPDRHANFGHMEELPHCLSTSPDRHEILGSGCPESCGWGFCPYRAASPDEPNEHRGISRGFCRSERRKVGRRSPAWQHSIKVSRLSDYWEQMEYKARR